MDCRYLDPWKDRGEVKVIWKELASVSSIPYQLAWPWVDHWLNSLESLKKDLVCIAISKQGKSACTYFAGFATIVRRFFFKSKCVFINSSGNTEADSLHIEYNCLLKGPGLEIGLADIISTIKNDWDEIIFPGVAFKDYESLCSGSDLKGVRIIIDKDVPAPFVDLEAVRRSEGGYLTLLSSKTRAHIRRSYRAYLEKGSVSLSDAKTVSEAENIYNEMVELHQRLWAGRGKAGAFTSKYFYEFHLNLIRSRFDKGEVQLLRVASGDSIIGCLYNFIYRGRVYFYQSGINYDLDKRVQPGFVALHEAIEYNARIGNSIFDFMGGEGEYKRSLGIGCDRIVWFRIQKRRLKFIVEDALVVLYRFIKKHRQRFNLVTG